MKKALITVALAFSTTVGFAQTMVTATQVCQRIASINGSNGSICAQLISRNNFDPASLKLAYAAVAQSSSTAIEIMRETANRRMDPMAGELCESVVAINASNGVVCAKTVVDANVSPELVRIARAVLQQGSTYAIGTLQAGVNTYLYAPLATVCERMASINGSNTVLCVKTIANKVSMNGSEQICQTSLSQGSSYALQCLQGIVMDYTPIPQPTTIMVELYQLQDLRRSLLKARAQLNRGMTENAVRTLEEAAQSVDLMLSNPSVQ